MNAGGRTARADLRGGVGWMVFGLVILALAWRMDRFESMGAPLYTAPGLVPGLLGAMLVLLGALLAWRGWRQQRAAAQASLPAGAGDPGYGPLFNARVVLALLLCLAYAVGMVGRLPFAAATAVFVAAFTWLFSETSSTPRRLIVALLSGVLTALVVVLVFQELFLVRLP